MCLNKITKITRKKGLTAITYTYNDILKDSNSVFVNSFFLTFFCLCP